ncbi:hypothetical protein YN1HA_18580 [Sulfurisphaera ohwakuensis]
MTELRIIAKRLTIEGLLAKISLFNRIYWVGKIIFLFDKRFKLISRISIKIKV